MMNFLSALTTGATAVPELTFEPARFIEMLYYMGVGMLVIFVIISVIILATVAINRIFSGKQDTAN